MARKRKDKEKAARPARSRKPAPKGAEVKDLEEVGGGMTFDDGIVLSTSVVLVIAVVLVFMAGGAYSA